MLVLRSCTLRRVLDLHHSTWSCLPLGPWESFRDEFVQFCAEQSWLTDSVVLPPWPSLQKCCPVECIESLSVHGMHSAENKDRVPDPKARWECRTYKEFPALLETVTCYRWLLCMLGM